MQTDVFFKDLAAIDSKLAEYSTSLRKLKSDISEIQSQESENTSKLQKFKNNQESQEREMKCLQIEIDDSVREIKFLADILTFFGAYLPPLERARNCSETLNDRVTMDLRLSLESGT
jgi:chromosome segregation ATPase